MVTLDCGTYDHAAVYAFAVACVQRAYFLVIATLRVIKMYPAASGTRYQGILYVLLCAEVRP